MPNVDLTLRTTGRTPSELSFQGTETTRLTVLQRYLTTFDQQGYVVIPIEVALQKPSMLLGVGECFPQLKFKVQRMQDFQFESSRIYLNFPDRPPVDTSLENRPLEGRIHRGAMEAGVMDLLSALRPKESIALGFMKAMRVSPGQGFGQHYDSLTSCSFRDTFLWYPEGSYSRPLKVFTKERQWIDVPVEPSEILLLKGNTYHHLPPGANSNPKFRYSFVVASRAASL